MIFTIEKSMKSTLWLAKIEKVEFLGDADVLWRITLTDKYRRVRIVLDEDACDRHLCRATGPFNDPAEIVGKTLIVVFDRLGDPVACYKPDENDDYEGGLYPPRPQAFSAYRDKDGRVCSEIGAGPVFQP